MIETYIGVPPEYWYEDPANFPNSERIREEIVVFDASERRDAEPSFQQQIADLLNGRDPSTPEDPYSSQLIGREYDMFGRRLAPQT